MESGRFDFGLTSNLTITLDVLPLWLQVFDYMVDSESHEFVKWADISPPYTATPHIGIPSDAFVHSTQIEQIMTILGKGIDNQCLFYKLIFLITFKCFYGSKMFLYNCSFKKRNLFSNNNNNNDFI